MNNNINVDFNDFYGAYLKNANKKQINNLNNIKLNQLNKLNKINKININKNKLNNKLNIIKEFLKIFKI